ncbi:MAG: hypothetical protein R6V04_15035 [bacterium]
MNNKLSSNELIALVKSVFSPASSDKRIALLIDIPDQKVTDNNGWKERRTIGYDWYQGLNQVKTSLKLSEVNLVAYPNVHSNNADLPEKCYVMDSFSEALNTENVRNYGELDDLARVLDNHQIIFALTEFSATAPLKLRAKEENFRAATMPGFSAAMLPALKLDYDKINQRVNVIKKKLDVSKSVDIEFTVGRKEKYSVCFDLRHRQAHASGGRFPDSGTAGNLPSGESYIVPYEGEKTEKSLSSGILPVQFENEVVLYQIKENKAVTVLSKGPYSENEKAKIAEEPAYSNIAEIGFGILKDFGIKPVNEILIDEKLGLHIAFGRSDHFGGAVGVDDFSSPETVEHTDRIFIPEIQSQVNVDKVTLKKNDESEEVLMEDNEYTV